MKINEVKFEMKANIGNYEHELLSISGIPEEGETLDYAIETLKGAVYEKLGRNKTEKSISNPSEKNGPVSEEVKDTVHGGHKANTENGVLPPVSQPSSTPSTPEKPKRTRKTKEKPIVEEKTEEIVKEETVTTTEEQMDLPLETKPTVEGQIEIHDFDRTNELHRTQFNTLMLPILEAKFGPTYGKNPKALGCVKPVVAEMLGKEFLQFEGGKVKVIEEFKEEVIKLVDKYAM